MACTWAFTVCFFCINVFIVKRWGRLNKRPLGLWHRGRHRLRRVLWTPRLHTPLSPQYLKAVITPECLLILDYRHLNLEQWLFRELPAQLAGEGQLVTYPLPFEFRAMEALLQYRVSSQRCLGGRHANRPGQRRRGTERRCGVGDTGRGAHLLECVVISAVSRWPGRVSVRPPCGGA